MVDKSAAGQKKKAAVRDSFKVKQNPFANTAVGMVGAALGVAAAAGVGPLVVPAAVVGGAAGYLLTNKTPQE